MCFTAYSCYRQGRPEFPPYDQLVGSIPFCGTQEKVQLEADAGIQRCDKAGCIALLEAEHVRRAKLCLLVRELIMIKLFEHDKTAYEAALELREGTNRA